MKLFYTIFALLLAVVLAAPPKITVPPAVIQNDGITVPSVVIEDGEVTVPADPLNLRYCCKSVTVGGKYETVCGDICSKRLQLFYCCKTVSVSTGGYATVCGELC
ncbi:unnamed protein product [Caenorhabditis brenneri]